MDISEMYKRIFLLIVISVGHGRASTSCVEGIGVLYTNISLNKPANQSSLYNGNSDNGLHGFAWRANDGNKSSTYGDGSCSHVANIVDSHWWQVDLQDVYNVTSVSIVNRDTHAGKLKDFGIEVSMTDQDDGNGRLVNANPCHYHVGAGVGDGEERAFPCTPGAVGRYLRIYMEMRQSMWEALTLCEVEVKGYRYVCTTTPYIQSSSPEPSTAILLTSYYTTTVLTTSDFDGSLSSTSSYYVEAFSTTSEFTTHLLSTSDYTTMMSSGSILPTTSQATELTSAATTTPMNNTSFPVTPANCYCTCTTLNVSVSLTELLETLRRELTVDTKTTGSFKRTLMSVSDDRPSAKNIGVIGIVILLLTIGGIMVIDIPHMIAFFYRP